MKGLWALFVLWVIAAAGCSGPDQAGWTKNQNQSEADLKACTDELIKKKLAPPAFESALEKCIVNKGHAYQTAGSAYDTTWGNKILDDIIVSRRTIRDFRPDFPGEDMVRQIITAGLHAPYASAAVETFADGYFRRFYVMRKGSESLEKASARLNAKVKEMSEDLEKKSMADAVYEDKSRSWRQRLKWFQDLGHVPGVTQAPYFIVIAEHRGIPDWGQHALAHCLENMWLKATALGLGFQVISVTSEMGDDEPFCTLLGLKPGEWDLMGCATGYAEYPLGPSTRPAADAVTMWLP